jgi:hypothetical protein
MAQSDGDVDAALVAEIAAEIHRFVQRFPNHYAACALAAVINRQIAGERVSAGERDLVLLTLAREAKKQAGAQRFAPPASPAARAVDERV